jgi:hypothetical protein
MTLVLNDAEQLRRRHGGTLEVLNQMSDKKTFIPDDVVAEIQEKARRDIEFRKMLVANPQEALGEFGIVIPGSSPDDKNYLETVHAMYDRAEFYRLFYFKILNEFRNETITMSPGLCIAATAHEDVDWDFEVTNYSIK